MRFTRGTRGFGDIALIARFPDFGAGAIGMGRALIPGPAHILFV